MVILLVAVILVPASVSAKTVEIDTSSSLSEYRQYLLERIEELTNEVARLQALLDQKEVQLAKATDYQLTLSKRVDKEPYESRFFDFDFEEIYFVDGDDLVNANNTGRIRLVDKQMYDLFVSVVGEEAVEDNVEEWRVFENRVTNTGAFVELMAGTDDWIVGVNRFEFDIGDEIVVTSFTDLFIHEYAHILLEDESEFRQKFTGTFWTRTDFRHKRRIENASEKDRFKIAHQYYKNNSDRFVTEYATTNEEEDMAETFVDFVLRDRPKGSDLEDDKIRFFYQSALFIKERAKIRSNLKKLDLL